MPLNENVSMPMETTYPKIMREPNPTVPFLSWNGYHNGQNIPTPSSLTMKEVKGIQNKVSSYFKSPKQGYQTILSIFDTLTVLCDETNTFHKKENFTAAQVTDALCNSTKPLKYRCTPQLLLNLHLIEVVGRADYSKIEIFQTPNGKPVYTDNIVKLYHFRKDWEEILAVIARTVKEDIATKENSIATQMNELDYKIKKPFNEIMLTFPYL